MVERSKTRPLLVSQCEAAFEASEWVLLVRGKRFVMRRGDEVRVCRGRPGERFMRVLNIQAREDRELQSIVPN
jgi:hypothetical protein